MGFFGRRILGQEAALVALARTEALAGVGDASLGEWIEHGNIAMHVRRRLSAAEQAIIGDIRDIRDTPEARTRHARMIPHLPPRYQREVV